MQTVQAICNTIITDSDKRVLQDALMKQWEEKRKEHAEKEWGQKIEEWKTHPESKSTQQEEARKKREKEEREIRKECRELYKQLDESVRNKKKEADPQIVKLQYMNRYPQCRNLQWTYETR